MQDLNWNDLRHVLAVAREGSLAGAARRLGVNESTVGRRIAETERRLGAGLFERSLGKAVPTEAGTAAIAAAERVEREVQGLEAEVAGADALVAGTVRLTAVPILANRVLAPAMTGLFTAFPGLKLELVAEPRDLSLTRREADIALRLARPRRELRTLARRIGQLDYAAYGSADRAAASLPWITYQDAMADLPQWRFVADRVARGEGSLSPALVNDAEALLQAVRAGLGKGLLPTLVAEREPGLVRLDDGKAALSRELWLLVHPELRALARIRAVMGWVIACFRDLPGGQVNPRPVGPGAAS